MHKATNSEMQDRVGEAGVDIAGHGVCVRGAFVARAPPTVRLHAARARSTRRTRGGRTRAAGAHVRIIVEAPRAHTCTIDFGCRLITLLESD